jgi:hypothetical protein
MILRAGVACSGVICEPERAFAWRVAEHLFSRKYAKSADENCTSWCRLIAKHASSVAREMHMAVCVEHVLCTSAMRNAVATVRDRVPRITQDGDSEVSKRRQALDGCHASTWNRRRVRRVDSETNPPGRGDSITRSSSLYYGPPYQAVVHAWSSSIAGVKPWCTKSTRETRRPGSALEAVRATASDGVGQSWAS